MENNYIEDLIARMLAGEASAAEREQVMQWVSSSDENKRYYDHAKMIFEGASQLHNIEEVDAHAAWKKVKERIGEKKEAKVFRLSPAIYRVAAGVALLVGITLVLFFMNRNNSPEQVLVSSGSQPVKEKMKDGSTIDLKKNTSITYAADFGKASREVELKGEAFFDVVHDESMPFVVKTGDLVIKDLGTSFNVMADEDSGIVKVDVVTGEVAFYSGDAVMLNLVAGESGVYDKEKKTAYKTSDEDRSKIAKLIKLQFNDKELGEVVETLNRTYNTKIVIANDKVKKCRITVTFNNESLDAVVDIIAETLGLQVKHSKGEIIFDGKGC